MRNWRAQLQAFKPARLPVDARERLRIVVGAWLGLLLTAALSAWLVQGQAWLVAPIGASAVLVFALPSSPLAQPWPVIAGNTSAALAGMVCQSLHLAGHLSMPLAAALAVAAGIAAMLALRCLHPPGGAVALLMVLNGVTEPSFALMPVLLNSSLLVLVGVAYNHASGRPYPHRSASSTQAEDADLATVLARHNQLLDISVDELRELLADTQQQGYQRRLAALRCADIMSRQLIAVHRSTPLETAWSLFREHGIKALPVQDQSQHLVGIVTPADFLRAAEVDAPLSLEQRLKVLRDWALRAGTASPKLVGQIMTRQVRVARADQHLAELLPLFAGSGHHHIPVLDDQQRLVGIVTQSDMVAALWRSSGSAPPGSDPAAQMAARRGNDGQQQA